ncbi:hypothetical protein [Rubrobacter indicoceani]|uniref:hypothetical protein n=1 Tax=Rubrobacter indicoceani TaxID=2051957 RepID=UPI0019698F7D|nr:hypothetical protein [Rubrobacter indicoceani]
MNFAPRRPGNLRLIKALVLCIFGLLLVSSCAQQPGSTGDSGSGGSAETSVAGEQIYPDILKAELEPSGDEYTLDVTVSSPYDSPERYADGWRVLSPDGTVLGEHQLTHDHAGQQPFTRTQTGLEVPDGVEEITVEGRDQANGYGGDTVTIPVAG